jgi:hypothetical protein
MGLRFQNRSININMRVDSPKIVLDAEESIFLIEGPSYPADAFDVYECVLQWLELNNYQFESQLNCEFKFNVMSSASRKFVLEILMGLEKASLKNGNILIMWYYEEFDDDMREAGIDLSENVNIPFQFISV